MLDLLYYKRKPLIRIVVDGSIFLKKNKDLQLDRKTSEEDIIFTRVF